MSTKGLHLNKLDKAQVPHGVYQFQGSWKDFQSFFYNIWGWQPSWLCDPDPVNKLLFSHLTEAHM